METRPSGGGVETREDLFARFAERVDRRRRADVARQKQKQAPRRWGAIAAFLGVATLVVVIAVADTAIPLILAGIGFAIVLLVVWGCWILDNIP